MLLELSHLQDLPVGSFDEGGLIGKVKKVVINPEDGRVIGFLVKTSGFFGETKIASFQDIIDVDQAGLVLRSTEALVDRSEVVRVADILKANFNLIGLRVVNKAKKDLGRVNNALIDSNTGDIMRLYIKKLFSELVFDHSQIVEITLKNVVLKSEREKKAKKPVSSLAQPEIA